MITTKRKQKRELWDVLVLVHDQIINFIDIGSEGWQLVTVIPKGKFYAHQVYYFKRPRRKK